MEANHPIFVMSDLHMGDGGARDNFAVGDRERQLSLFLDYVTQEQGELIVLGDLFEFWQMNLSRIVTRHRLLVDRLAEMNAIYVLGNHDADLDGFVGTGFMPHPLFQRMCGPFERQIGGKRFKFMHGHEVDPVNQGDEPKWGRIFCIIAGMAEDKNGSPLYPNGDYVENDLEKIGDSLLGPWTALVSRISRWLHCGGLGIAGEHLTPAQNPDRAKEMLDLYREDKETNGYDVLIAGHTHQPGRIGDWYFNSGTWARKMNNFVRISPTGDVTVFDWADGQPKPNTTMLKM
jgi:UDP-2,3-diacylglucosamine pyrophosphatase LpxH